MKTRFFLSFIVILFASVSIIRAQNPQKYPANYASAPRFKALVYYTPNAEEAHVKFAEDGVKFFKKLNYGNGFILNITTDFSSFTYQKLKDYNVVVMLNTMPSSPSEREAFQQYMENGGG